jgi:hypothetical protein
LENYLKGYLDVIPESERKKIADIIKQNQDLITAGAWSEQEFEKAIQQLVMNHEQMTMYVPQEDVLSSSKHNQFFSGLQTDLSLLFAESDLIESGLTSYHRLYEGIISDLQREINILTQHVESLRLTNESENGVVVKTIDFNTDSQIETFTEGNQYLFVDRDNSITPIVVVERDVESSRMILNKRSSYDHIHDEKGSITATIKIDDRRGVPIKQATEGLYGIGKILDNSNETYWGEVVLVDEPINTKMTTTNPDGSIATIDGGGVYVKFTLTLQKQELCSQIMMSFFTKYPMEMISIQYEEDTDTWHKPKELIGYLQEKQSAGTIRVTFPSIIAKRFTFIINQKNYEKNVYAINKRAFDEKDLWEKIAKKEADTTLDLGDGLETVAQGDLDSWSGWSIYVDALHKHNADVAAWEKEMDAYNKEYADYLVKLSNY